MGFDSHCIFSPLVLRIDLRNVFWGVESSRAFGGSIKPFRLRQYPTHTRGGEVADAPTPSEHSDESVVKQRMAHGPSLARK